VSIVVDTNVLSELLRGAPAPAVRAWLFAQHPESLFVTAVTQAEMMMGAQLLPSGKRRQRLEQSLYELFSIEFANRILPFDHRAAPYFAELVAVRRRAGKPIAHFDAQIAAIAHARDARVATRNIGDFVGCGLALINPWD